MKSEFNGVDVHVAASELDGMACGGRVDKAYQCGEKEVLLRLFKSGVGVLDLVVTPRFFCISKYRRSVPEKPSSFAMQLRKVLEGGFLRSVRQKEFDRIVEFAFDVRGVAYYVVAEFFSTGNVFLLDSGGRIMGLLEWQRWKDRTLGVGRIYEHPPAVANPLKMVEGEFDGIKSSGKGAAAAIASATSLGGFYAEEICLRAGVDRKKRCIDLSDKELSGLWSSFSGLLDSIGECRRPAVVYEKGVPVDVVPIEVEKYSTLEKEAFDSFNEAADEYFSLKEKSDAESLVEKKADKRMEKLEAILSQQKEVLERLRDDAGADRRRGDVIYERYAELEGIVNFIREERVKGAKDEEILKKLGGRGVVKGLDRFELTLDF